VQMCPTAYRGWWDFFFFLLVPVPVLFACAWSLELELMIALLRCYAERKSQGLLHAPNAVYSLSYSLRTA